MGVEWLTLHVKLPLSLKRTFVYSEAKQRFTQETEGDKRKSMIDSLDYGAMLLARLYRRSDLTNSEAYSQNVICKRWKDGGFLFPRFFGSGLIRV